MNLLAWIGGAALLVVGGAVALFRWWDKSFRE